MKITAFHLYNDYSGSPKVLRNVIEGLLYKKHKITIITSNTNGVLDDLSKDDDLSYDYFIIHLIINFYGSVILFGHNFVYSSKLSNIKIHRSFILTPLCL